VDGNTNTIQLPGREKEIVFSVISDDPPPLMVLSLTGEHLKLWMDGRRINGIIYSLTQNFRKTETGVWWSCDNL